MADGTGDSIVTWAVIAQALFAGAVLVVTVWYARTTKQMLDLQVEPDIDCLLMPIEEGSDDIAFSIRNNTAAKLVRLDVKINLPEQGVEGPNDPDVFHLSERLALGDLGPEASVDFRYQNGLRLWEKNRPERLQDGPDAVKTFFSQLLVHISCQRRVDARRFYFSFRYSILSDPRLYAVTQTHKERMFSGHRIIVRRTGQQPALGSDSFLEPKPTVGSSV
jgi:hypothetical protein